jgi:AraC-like DNA-binding protein
MNLIIDYQIHILIKKVIEKKMAKMNVKYKLLSSLQIEILGDLPLSRYKQLKEELGEYGIVIKESQKDQVVHFVQKVKDAVNEIIFDEKYQSMKTSSILAEKLNMSYGYISTAFSEYTLTTLEHYIILQKIERAKVLMLSCEHSLSEIAFMLNYSSVGHLSSQFKKLTGLTATAFIKIIRKRNEMIMVPDVRNH